NDNRSTSTDGANDHDAMAFVQQRLDTIETAVKSIQALLEDQRQIREWYSVAEAADALGKAEFTVREWCRLGRVTAHKRPCGRGRSQEWIISHTELVRIRNKGLLPLNL
ncbi:MAG: helix-turn-helix domain-containing protein, partial [Pirellulales bacterium]